MREPAHATVPDSHPSFSKQPQRSACARPLPTFHVDMDVNACLQISCRATESLQTLRCRPPASKPSIHVYKWGQADGRPPARVLRVLALLANFTYIPSCHFGPRLLRSSAWLLSVNFGPVYHAFNRKPLLILNSSCGCYSHKSSSVVVANVTNCLPAHHPNDSI